MHDSFADFDFPVLPRPEMGSVTPDSDDGFFQGGLQAVYPLAILADVGK